MAQAETASGADPTGLEIIAVLLMVMGVVLLGMIFMLSIRAKLGRRHGATSSPRERIEEIRRGSDSRRDDLAAEEARLLSTAQRLSSQLDLKALRIEQLLEQAAQRVEQLRALVREEVSEASHQPSALPRQPATRREARTETEESTERAEVAARRRSAGGQVAAPVRDPLTAAIYRLADSGRAPVEIARELEEQIGKVELILALRGSEEDARLEA